jgi:hypothetical protein
MSAAKPLLHQADSKCRRMPAEISVRALISLGCCPDLAQVGAYLSGVVLRVLGVVGGFDGQDAAAEDIAIEISYAQAHFRCRWPI